MLKVSGRDALFVTIDLLGAESVKMVRMSVMNDALKNICNAEKAGKRQVMPSPFVRPRPL